MASLGRGCGPFEALGLSPLYR
ncbi:uncharacterized protein G2W53_039373 [Senna tora]|uniref:Uncharacterized protein n=1 Tax=Senna tora TaxID=362788 RepID=A0A834ST84_9FABA|nr:uncharacterized protein G2W53_039373 [Senna tora]